jgi:DNA-binding IclR family transcriptional regulator
MGSGPTAWTYLDTLARAAGMSRSAVKRKLEALEQEGLVASTKAPAGLRYRLRTGDASGLAEAAADQARQFA